MKRSWTIAVLIFCFHLCNAQNDPAIYFKGAIAANRAKQYKNIVNNIINKNLSLNLVDSTESNWEQAFDALEVLQYKSPWVNGKVETAFDSISKRSVDFQQAAVTLAYANYSGIFHDSVWMLIYTTENAKLFAISSEYIVRDDPSEVTKVKLEVMAGRMQAALAMQNKLTVADSLILSGLINHLDPPDSNDVQLLPEIFSSNFLPGQIVVFSFQRSNRNFPGIAIVRDSGGHFIQIGHGIPFSVSQLARSITGLPYYFIGGNTPQGVYKMDGLDSSGSDYIGPTADIQLRIPVEDSIADFLSDSTIKDSVWTVDLYNKLVPPVLQNYIPFYETYFAGKIGRTEIIAHGTTVNPNYYIGKTYYPFTPTEGCLCTNETWSDIDGRRTSSDEKKLVDAIKQTGRTTGYYVVIDIDDQQKPVSIEEILPYLNSKY
jgi:hypothetical protein